MQTYVKALTFFFKAASEYCSEGVKGTLTLFSSGSFPVQNLTTLLIAYFSYYRIPVLQPQEEEEQIGTIFTRKKYIQQAFLCFEAIFHISKIMAKS